MTATRTQDINKAKTRKRVVWIVGGALALIALAVALAPKSIPSDFSKVERKGMKVTLDHEGKTQIHDRFAVSAPFSGRMGRIELEPGDEVVAGETVLLTLWPNESALLDPRSHTQAVAEVEAATVAVRAATAERDRARSAQELAASEWRRIQPLVDDGVVSTLDAERARAAADTAARALDVAAAGIHAARYQLEAAQARLGAGSSGSNDGPKEVFEIHSPIDGIVLRRLRQSEAAVQSGELILEIGNRSDLEVVADYLSSDAVQMSPGMPATLNQWGGDEVLTGRIRRIEPAGFLKVSALGVEEQRVNVVIEFDAPEAAGRVLGDGYRVEVQVVTWQTEDALTIPTNCLFRHDAGWATFLVENGKASLVPVEVGHRNPLTAEVLNGVDEGATVIAHPAEAIDEGTKVTAREL
ncbi:MAG: HlyD family efflux transporter periplasmic adaptor subunit [Thermoanaerobaculia bacterium]|nr:HlyD family efflux transporter periplasmic adaptor subunit [Thermoanaerobaculia bacterium]